MKICPQCLVGVPKSKSLCHQCGRDMRKGKGNTSFTTNSQKKFYKAVFKLILLVSLLTVGYLYKDQVVDYVAHAESGYLEKVESIRENMRSHQYRSDIVLLETMGDSRPVKKDVDTLRQEALEALPAAGAE